MSVGHDHEHDGGHDGDGDHDHDRDQEGDRDHGHTADERGDLPRHAGKGSILFLDAPSGLSGDMTVSALVDLGVPRTVVAEAVAALPISGFHIHFGSRQRSGIVATSFDVHVDEAQPERAYAAVRSLLDESRLAEPVRAKAQATFRKLAEAEARVHRMPLDLVHFHEVGAVDALVDVVGSAAALDWVGAEVIVSPLPMGRGYVTARHGRLPLPPPAVVECLASFDTYDGGADFEFVTPTGAAIVAAHARGTSRWPSLTPERVGWGAGKATLPDRPNLLRVVLGQVAPGPTGRDARSESAASHVVLQANLDDSTGELLAAAIEMVMAAGALDVWASPVTMKKGRPGWVLSAIAEAARSDEVAGSILRETTSIGVRRYPVSRVERPRRQVDVETSFGTIRVKIAAGPFGPPQVKPEFDDCFRAARAHGVPVREVLRAALSAALSRGDP
jgi:uncharacterized protein (TIGR00299 family) protein